MRDNKTIVIQRRFCGPRDSGNGGYTAGLLGALIPGAAEVTLRQPPPLEQPLRLVNDGAGWRLLAGEELVAEAAPASLDLPLPDPPAWDEARRAEQGYVGFSNHVFPTCFVCGPERQSGDGLRIFCGPWRNGLVAATWTPDASLADGDGFVRPEFLWSAVDCPGASAVIGRRDPAAPVTPPATPIVLGRMTARVFAPLPVGQPTTIAGWFLAGQGRKYEVAAAVFTPSGTPVVAARATWIAVKTP